MPETITVTSADLIPDEVPGARWAVIDEGGFLPAGHWRVVYRVQDTNRSRSESYGGTWWLKFYTGFWNLPRAVLLVVAPLPSQHWWERHHEWRSRRMMEGR